jgi:quercetin dioxygenase-like cupin family protein
VGGTIRHSEQADDFEVNGERIRPLLSHLTGSPIEVIEQGGQRGSGPPPHHHPWDEIFFVLEGELDVTIGDDQVQRMGPGSIAHVPGGTVHSFRNVSDQMRLLSITTEGRAVEMFTALANVPPTEYPEVGPRFGTIRADLPNHPHRRG